jgi:hypothetical protein
MVQVNVVVYGSLSRKFGGKHIAEVAVELPEGSSKANLLDHLGISPQDRSYIFINAVLCDVPGLITDGAEPLNDLDHVGIFAHDYMWPYQYRDGVRMSESLKRAMQEHGAMHNVYKSDKNPPIV